MIGSNILLFPDTGAEFIRALRTAALYSKQVCVLTRPEYPNLSDHVKFLKERVYKGHYLVSPLVDLRVLQYLSFIQDSQLEMRILKDEGVLIEVGDLNDNKTIEEGTAKLAKDHQLWKRMGDAYWAWPPSLHDLRCFWSPDGTPERHPQLLEEIRQKLGGQFPSTEGTLLLDGLRFLEQLQQVEDEIKKAKTLSSKSRRKKMAELQAQCERWGKPDLVMQAEGFSDRERTHQAFFAGYLTQLAALSERMGTSLLTWSPTYQEALSAYRRGLMTRSKLQSRQVVEARLGQVAVERRIPLAHDLPLEDILELRKARLSEIEAFRTALGELATEVDLEGTDEDIELQVQALVSARIDPAVHDLRVALYSSRLEALTKVGKNWKAIAAGTVAIAVGVEAGAPANITGLLAALGIVGHAVFEGIIERKNLLRRSQWSLLLHLERLGSEQP